MEWIGIIILFILVLILDREQKRLKRRIKANEDYIKDLYRIDDERLLK